ncbi:phosphate ABC transporter substrate-binding protein (PhoT family) [Blastococcus colisei]|uniref:Phosphate-binding protein n=1 Tax=Blastococcus colisei TaxID=1564162 RepID=A0A543PAT5_9ACTN|nr:PstS family phosphate ABC transporter substrate-binding protein [Blastococcus colisei]TQN41198.1 phosphate ABC transporter substrate-binding protein (PhoT family) [Blastococcus colisei]
MTTSTLRRRSVPAAAVLALALALSACGGSNEEEAGGGDSALSGDVLSDGSSTVAPLTSAAAEFFAEEEPGVNVSVATSGTGGGFEVFCQGTTDVSNASRPISDEEIAICEENGVEYTELTVARDALTVVTSAENDFITCLTTEQLATLWGPEAEGTITTWDQIDPSFPAEPIELYGPGTDSGTFDYFTDEINGDEGVSRTDYNASEDDNVIVQGVSGSPNALGYFGFTYFEENADSLKAIEVDSGDGCVAPSAETVQDGSYTPLGRPLFIYVNDASYSEKPGVAAFVDFYAQNDSDIAEAAQYIPLNDEQRGELESAVGSIS